MGATIDVPTAATQVACELCLKEVPVSEAVIAEATDYFTYFCGLECYERWKHRGEQGAAELPEQPSGA
jgi:hypothetical protein